MAGYGWEEYDVRVGGKQAIYDQGNKIDIQTEFVKVEGGEHGRFIRLMSWWPETYSTARRTLGRSHQGDPKIRW
jgi:Glycosyl hydrolase family 63 N-terminal domain